MAKKEAKDLKFGVPYTAENSSYQVAKMRTLYYRPAIYINKETNQDMVDFLKTKDSVSDYIISLIRADMTKEKR